MTEQVRELYDAARQVMDGAGVAAAEDELWPQVAELGWLMVTTPEELGGLEMGLPEACALYQEMGRGLATAPFLSAMLAIEALANSDFAARGEWLERLVAGEDYVATPLVDGDLTLVDGDGLRVAGNAQAVPSADKASHLLVCGEDAVALVPLEGVGKTHCPTWDETRRLFEVDCDGVAVDAALVLARGADAKALAARLATVRDFALAADSVGGAAALLETTVEYLQTRQQFARPLAMFQALKHRCADLKATIEAAEALLQENLSRLSWDDLAGAQDLGRAACELASAAYTTTAEESLQLHGGIGMTEEHVCHLFLKRAMLNEHLGRPRESYARELAAGLLDAAGAG